mgnify:CR=1 FL=1
MTMHGRSGRHGGGNKVGAAARTLAATICVGAGITAVILGLGAGRNWAVG